MPPRGCLQSGLRSRSGIIRASRRFYQAAARWAEQLRRHEQNRPCDAYWQRQV